MAFRISIATFFAGRKVIRRAVNVMFMGFSYVMEIETGVPCFVRHMAEEIFFLYLCGKDKGFKSEELAQQTGLKITLHYTNTIKSTTHLSPGIFMYLLIPSADKTGSR